MSEIGDWISEHPAVDVVASVALVTVHYAVVHFWHRGALADGLKSDTLSGLYVTAAQVIAIVGGLCAVGISVLLANQGARSVAVRKTHGLALRRNWRSLLVITVGGASLCLLAQALQGAKSERVTPWAQWVFELALLMTIAAFGRLIWLVGALMAVGDADLADEGRPAPPSIGPRWRSAEDLKDRGTHKRMTG